MNFHVICVCSEFGKVTLQNATLGLVDSHGAAYTGQSGWNSAGEESEQDDQSSDVVMLLMGLTMVLVFMLFMAHSRDTKVAGAERELAVRIG